VRSTVLRGIRKEKTKKKFSHCSVRAHGIGCGDWIGAPLFRHGKSSPFSLVLALASALDVGSLLRKSAVVVVDGTIRHPSSHRPMGFMGTGLEGGVRIDEAMKREEAVIRTSGIYFAWCRGMFDEQIDGVVWGRWRDSTGREGFSGPGAGGP